MTERDRAKAEFVARYGSLPPARTFSGMRGTRSRLNAASYEVAARVERLRKQIGATDEAAR